MTIRAVTLENIGDNEGKPVVYFEGAGKGLLLNRTNATTIAGHYGPETEHWIGKPITLFASETSFGGARVACLRVRSTPPPDGSVRPSEPAIKPVRGNGQNSLRSLWLAATDSNRKGNTKVANQKKRREIKVLSVRQPYADLIISGNKWCENRTWRTRYRGELYIHASRWDRFARQSFESTYGRTCEELFAGGCRIGCIIGRVNLVDMIDLEKAGYDERLIRHVARRHGLPTDQDAMQHVQGPLCWIVSQPSLLKEPIPARGKLNVWNTTVDLSRLTFGQPTKKDARNTLRRTRKRTISVGSCVNYKRRNFVVVAVDENLVGVAQTRGGSPVDWFDVSELELGWHR